MVVVVENSFSPPFRRRSPPAARLPANEEGVLKGGGEKEESAGKHGESQLFPRMACFSTLKTQIAPSQLVFGIDH